MDYQINTNSQQTNEVMKKPKKPIYKKWWFWLIIVIVLFFAFLLFSPSDEEETKDNTIETIQSEEQSTQESSDVKKVEAGNLVTTDDWKISYLSCNSDFKGYSEYADIEDGKKVVEAEFKFENISDIDLVTPTFECYADGEKCEKFFSIDDYKNIDFESVASTRSLTGKIYYEVPENASEIELEAEDSSLFSSDKIIFVIK